MAILVTKGRFCIKYFWKWFTWSKKLTLKWKMAVPKFRKPTKSYYKKIYMGWKW
jgi:hypothetical protein